MEAGFGNCKGKGKNTIQLVYYKIRVILQSNKSEMLYIVQDLRYLFILKNLKSKILITYLKIVKIVMIRGYNGKILY
jgi:hypothetical protein